MYRNPAVPYAKEMGFPVDSSFGIGKWRRSLLSSDKFGVVGLWICGGCIFIYFGGYGMVSYADLFPLCFMRGIGKFIISCHCINFKLFIIFFLLPKKQHMSLIEIENQR